MSKSMRERRSVKQGASNERTLSGKKLQKALREAWNRGYCALGDDIGFEPGSWPEFWNELEHTKNPYRKEPWE